MKPLIQSLAARVRAPKLGKKEGQTLAEYALILAFISVVAIATLLSMGGKVKTVYSSVNTQLGSAQLGGQTAATRH